MMFARGSASQGQRCYSIMSKAKRQAGIPLDLIKPSKGARLGPPRKPFRSPHGNASEIVSRWKDIKEQIRPGKDGMKRFAVKNEPITAAYMGESDNRMGQLSDSDTMDRRQPRRWRDDPDDDYHPVRDPASRWNYENQQDYRRSAQQHMEHEMYSFDTTREPEARVLERMMKTIDSHQHERQVRRELVLQPHKNRDYDLDALQESADRWRQPADIHTRLVKVAKDIVQPENPHVLRVAVIGAANAGKSTLINSFVGESVSVVSPKAHTTRERVLGVLTEGNHQVVSGSIGGRGAPGFDCALLWKVNVSIDWALLDLFGYSRRDP